MCECVCFIIVLCVSVHCFDGLTDGDPKSIELWRVHSVTTVYEKTSLIFLFLSVFFPNRSFVRCECVSGSGVREPIGDTNQFPGLANNVASGLFGRNLWDIQSLGALTLAAFLSQIISVSIFVCVRFFFFRFSALSLFFFSFHVRVLCVVRSTVSWLDKHFVTLRLHRAHGRRIPTTVVVTVVAVEVSAWLSGVDIY